MQEIIKNTGTAKINKLSITLAVSQYLSLLKSQKQLLACKNTTANVAITFARSIYSILLVGPMSRFSTS